MITSGAEGWLVLPAVSVAVVVKLVRQEDGSLLLLARGIERFRVLRFVPKDACVRAEIEVLHPTAPATSGAAWEAATRMLVAATAVIGGALLSRWLARRYLREPVVSGGE